jgi:HK97 family phage prohead protease
MMPQTAEKKREIRNFDVSNVELREDSNTLTLNGYASVFDKPYDVYNFSETISRGAFAKTLQERADVRLLVNHDGLPLARTKSGTLQLSEDNTGLKVRADLEPSDPDVQALVPKFRRGDLSEMSFGFRVIRDEWNDSMTERRINEVRLYDVSVVTMPANPATSATLRQIDEVCDFFGVAPEQVAAILEMRSADQELNEDQLAILRKVYDAVGAIVIREDETKTETSEEEVEDESWKDQLANQLARLSA